MRAMAATARQTASERMRALVYLHTGDHALLLEPLHETCAVVKALGQRLVEEDYTADVLADRRSGKQSATVLASILFGVLNANSVEPLLDSACALIRSKDSLAGLNHRLCYIFQALVNSLGANIHLKIEYGDEPHHIVEGLFKCFAKALDVATSVDPRTEGQLPSTKDKLT